MAGTLTLSGDPNANPSFAPAQYTYNDLFNNNGLQTVGQSNIQAGDITPVNGGGQVLGTNTGGTNTQTYSPALLNAINAGYDQQIGNTNNQIALANQNYGQSQQRINDSRVAQQAPLDVQHTAGINNLGLQQQQLDTSRANSLRDLTHQMQGMIAGYNNQLGTYGAGDSSATGLINYALTQQGNRGINDLNTQADYQQTGLNQGKQDLEANYQAGLKQLDDWKANQLNTLGQQYQTQIQQLNAYAQQLGADRARYLATYMPQAAQAAIDALGAINAQHQTGVDSLNSNFQQLSSAQTPDLNPYSQYKVGALNPATLSGLNLAHNQVSSEPVQTQVSLQRRPEQQPL